MLTRAAMVLILASCTAKPSPTVAAPSSTAIQRDLSVPAGQFAELNLELGAGATVVVDFNSDAAVAWNIHSHPGREVVIHHQGNGLSAHLPFAPPRPGGYSYLWENKGTAPVQLMIRGQLHGDGTIHSWVPAR